jgi:hypothetical protein
MRTIIFATALLLFTSGIASAQHMVPMTDAEIDAQLRLNSAACKAVGLDDAGQVCAMGQALNTKLNQARQPKPESKKDP